MRSKLPLIAAGAAGVAAGAMAVRRRIASSYSGPVLGLGPDGRPGLAVITGGSLGIGAAFAQQLAAQGYDLLLIARRPEHLDALAAQLGPAYGVSVETIPADLAQAGAVERLASYIGAAGDLALLINNAGFGLSGKFARADLDRQMDMVRLHVQTSMRLTRAALPPMLSRGSGAVINVASLAAFIPLPGNATYGATKAYLVMFSEALAAELNGTGVRVQALCPGFVSTPFHQPADRPPSEGGSFPKFLFMSADDVARNSLATLHRGDILCVPGAGYHLLSILARTMPTSALLRHAAALALRRARSG